MMHDGSFPKIILKTGGFKQLEGWQVFSHEYNRSSDASQAHFKVHLSEWNDPSEAWSSKNLAESL